MAKKREEYGNESIQVLNGAERVRKRPAVIFGSDGIEGCEHATFEIVCLHRSRICSDYLRYPVHLSVQRTRQNS